MEQTPCSNHQEKRCYQSSSVKGCSVNTTGKERCPPFVLSDKVNEMIFKLQTAGGVGVRRWRLHWGEKYNF